LSTSRLALIVVTVKTGRFLQELGGREACTGITHTGRHDQNRHAVCSRPKGDRCPHQICRGPKCPICGVFAAARGTSR
jgi:hypothetical protein